MDALTSVSNMSQIKNAPGVRKANNELHAVGLGVMNLHGYLAKEKIEKLPGLISRIRIKA